MTALSGQVRPLFTIVTVTLNPGKELAPTVQSVLEQTFADFELLIKDGGSTDGTEKLTWPNPRVKRFTSKDSGIFDAMNQALTLAQGRYIHFLNAGDVLVDPQVMSDVSDVIRNHPGIPFLYGDVEKPSSRSGYELYPSRLSRRFLFMDTVCHQAWFVAHDAYVRAGGFETRRVTGADPRLFLRLLLRDRLEHRHVGRVVVRYCGSGVSAQPENVSEATSWCDELRRELYSPCEYALFSAAKAMTALAKRVFYDVGLWTLLRPLQKRRALRRGSRRLGA